MKILSIHIDNFGKYSNFDQTFDGKLTSICEKNGGGKTTIATFITVMLYGMSKSVKDKTDREHYLPFNGGNYGGKIVFSHAGDTYEVTRQFHGKSKAKDTVKILKNHNNYSPSNDLEIGEEIIGINEDAFRRVCFIDDNGLDFSEESISGKLGGLAGDYDAVKVEEATEKLLEKIKEIKPLRGNNGLLGNAEQELSDVEQEIGRLIDLQEDLTKVQKEYHKAVDEHNAIAQEISSIREAAVNEEKKKHAKELSEAVKQCEETRDNLLAKYPKGIPSNDEIEQVKISIRDASANPQVFQELNANESDMLSKLSIRFVDGVPSQDEMDDINNKINKLETLETSIATEKKTSDAEKEIVNRFSSNPLNEEEIESIRNKLASYKTISYEYENTDSTLSKTTTRTVSSRSGKNFGIALFVVGGVATIAGIVACFFLFLLGIIAIAVGLLCVGLGIVFFLKNGKTNEISEEEKIINPKKQSLGEEKESIRKEIAIFLTRFYISDPDPVSGMTRFESEYSFYQSSLKTQEQTKSKNEQDMATIESLKTTIDSFFDKYGYREGDYSSRLLTLQKEIGTFDSLKQRKESNEASKTKHDETKKKAEEQIKIFCAKYAVNSENLSIWIVEASKAEQALEHANNDLSKTKEKYEDYLKNNPVKETPAPKTSLEELQKQEAEINRDIAEKRSTINDWESQLEELDGLYHKKSILINRISELSRRHLILSRVRDDLEKAQEVIKEKYVGPIKKEFGNYSKLIQKTNGLKIDLNANLELSYLADGEYRKWLHLSDGERTLVSFCLRLSLLKNMYKDSEVFAILDDPFVALDETSLPEVVESLKKLGDSTQLLYLTCHPSRMPK